MLAGIEARLGIYLALKLRYEFEVMDKQPTHVFTSPTPSVHMQGAKKLLE